MAAAPAARSERSSGAGHDFALAARRDLIDGLMLWELWGRLCWNEVKRRYRRTLLGPMWVTVSLGLFALVLSLVWSALWKINVAEYLPYLLSGLIPWVLIASSLGEACAAFIAGEAIMKSRQFPYSTLVYVVVARNTVMFGHNMIAYAIAGLLCGVPVTLYTVLAVPGLALLIANLSWMCLLVAILCLRFRDFQPLITVVLQTMMFITPVFWPVNQISGRASIVVDVNLFYHIIDIVRAPLLGKAPATQSYIVALLFALAGWLAVYWLLSKKRHRLVYWF